MRRLFFIVLKLVLILLILGAALWGVGLLSFRLTGAMAAAAAIGFGIAALAGLVGVWTSDARLPLGFAVLFVGLLSWWNGLQPSHQRDWIPELAHLPSIAREGDVLTVSNLRDFRWRTEEDYDQRWETRMPCSGVPNSATGSGSGRLGSSIDPCRKTSPVVFLATASQSAPIWTQRLPTLSATIS